MFLTFPVQSTQGMSKNHQKTSYDPKTGLGPNEMRNLALVDFLKSSRDYSRN